SDYIVSSTLTPYQRVLLSPHVPQANNAAIIPMFSYRFCREATTLFPIDFYMRQHVRMKGKTVAGQTHLKN
ncbi:MAG: hypothetical protein H7843_15805, partial [Nitrospirota bacterium]